MRRKNEENKEEQRNVTTMIMFSGWRMREHIHTYYAAICVQKVRSRTDIKISSFHEDSEDKDCKKVWNEPRAAVSYITTPSSLSSFLHPPWFFFRWGMPLGFQGVRSVVHEYSGLPPQWNDERHPPPPSMHSRRFSRVSPRKTSLLHASIHPAWHANRAIGSLNSSTPLRGRHRSSSFIKIKSHV